jgi:hypothetical protein
MEVTMRFLLLLIVCAGVVWSADPDAVVREFDAMAELPLWPGFNAKTVPLALSDGKSTRFYRHPKPPESVKVRANTSEEINGVVTATLMLKEGSEREQAAVLVHDAFHVFQRTKYPKWIANEAALFTYPAQDPEAIALARMESEALRRAVAIPESASCWAGLAVSLREKRFALVGAEIAAYDRATELNEGLAQYVQDKAAGSSESRIPEGGYMGADPRARLYATGQSMALALDRLVPEWKGKVTDSLDALLPREQALRCRFTDRESREMHEWAGREVVRRRTESEALRSSFLTREGWSIRLLAAKHPLMPGGFDPMNVRALSGREVLHGRLLKLVSDAGSVEVSGQESLTISAGAHPLFNGVSECLVTGLPFEPKVVQEGGVTTLSGAGVEAVFKGATVKRDGKLTTIYVP